MRYDSSYTTFDSISLAIRKATPHNFFFRIVPFSAIRIGDDFEFHRRIPSNKKRPFYFFPFIINISVKLDSRNSLSDLLL